VRKFTQVLSYELQQAADILLGKLAPGRAWHPPGKVDVRAIRAQTGLLQTHFARRFGFSTGVVREWEQGRRQPEAA
jgi:putative transcriptional regulator